MDNRNQDPGDVWTPPESSDDVRYPGSSSSFTPATRSYTASSSGQPYSNSAGPSSSSGHGNSFVPVDDHYAR